MSASLVGSEMCIRDRVGSRHADAHLRELARSTHLTPRTVQSASQESCLLYTSDAADDMQ
eukprot:5460031-Alexandrium_andersonii.AAC.1